MTAQDVSYLQKEIGDVNAQMIQGAFLVFALTSVAFMAATVTGKLELHKLVFIFAVGLSFWVAREDYLIHRAASSIQVLQAQDQDRFGGGAEFHGKTAEQLKGELKSRYLMFPLDLLAASALLWMLYQSGRVLWAQSDGAGFVIVSSIMIVSGILMTVIMQLLAKIRW